MYIHSVSSIYADIFNWILKERHNERKSEEAYAIKMSESFSLRDKRSGKSHIKREKNDSVSLFFECV